LHDEIKVRTSRSLFITDVLQASDVINGTDRYGAGCSVLMDFLEWRQLRATLHGQR